jgi:hypothetical protein
MSNYAQAVFFAPKDALTTGNPLKVIKGVEMDAELAAITTAIASKYDSATTTITLTGNLTAAALIPTAATVPANGVYLSAANTLAFASNTLLRASVNSTGNWVLAAPTAGIGLTVNQSVVSQPALKITSSNDSAFLDIAGIAGQDALITMEANGVALGTGAALRYISATSRFKINAAGGSISIGSNSVEHLIISNAGAITAFDTYNAINAMRVNATQETTTATATLTGCATAPTGTVVLSRTGNQVVASLPNGLQAASNTTACTLTGAIPAGYLPARQQDMTIVVTNNSVDVVGIARIAAASSTITLFILNGTFTAAGQKGLPAGTAITMTWLLD